MAELLPIDRAIMQAILDERASYRACTARQIARKLRYNNVYISKRLAVLKDLGLVDYTASIPGSIHLTGTVEVMHDSALPPIERADAEGADTVVSPEATVPAPVPTPDPPKESGVQAAKVKPAVKKVSRPR